MFFRVFLFSLFIFLNFPVFLGGCVFLLSVFMVFFKPGIRGVQVMFLFMTFWVMYFMQKSRLKVAKWVYSFFFLFFFLCFYVKKIIFFFIFFELRLVPTYYLVMKSRSPKRVLAANYFVLYTFFGGLPLLFSVLKFGVFKRFSFFYFFPSLFKGFFYFFILAFLIKLPVFFFHLWLPKAHVEASTEGSMILAGILLKLGSYGLILFNGYLNFNPILGVLVCVGGVFAGIFGLISKDLKKLAAYSSIIHMSYIVVSRSGLVFLRILGIVLMSVGHGFVSAGLFYLISVVYKFTGNRKIFFVKGVLKNFGFLIFFSGLLIILNRSPPGSVRFLGEVFMFVGGRVFLRAWKLIVVLFLNFFGGLLSVVFFMGLFQGNVKSKSFLIPPIKIKLVFRLIVFSFFSFFVFNVF